MQWALARPILRTTIRDQLSRPYRAYERAVEWSPISTKLVLGGFLGGLGDLIVQWREEKVDFRRLAAFTAFNAVFSGCANHFWYAALESHQLCIARKMALQHLFYNPVVYLPTFYFAFGTMYGMAPSACLAKLQAEFMHTYKLLVSTWVPLSFLQFKFIPQCHQVLFVSSVNVAWNAVLSFASSEKKTDENGSKDQEKEE